MNDEFSRVLHQQMEFFSSNPSADTLSRVRSEVGEASIFRAKLFFLISFVIYLAEMQGHIFNRLIKLHYINTELVLRIAVYVASASCRYFLPLLPSSDLNMDCS